MVRFLALDLLLHSYLAIRLLPDLPGGGPAVVAVLAAILAIAFALPLGFLGRRSRSQPWSDRLTFTGMLAVGAFSSLFVLTLARDLVLVATWPFAAAGTFVALRETTAAAVPILAALLTAIGYWNARRVPGVRRVDVPIAGLPAPLHGFSIVQVTDLHVGATIKRRHVEAVVERVNALDADLIAVTGDLVDGSVQELGAHTRPLERMKARHGAYFVTGNHEYYSGVHAWVAELTRLGLRVLLNEHVRLHHDGASLVVAGVTDYGAGRFVAGHDSDPHRALAGAPDGAVRVLLAHQPRSAFEAQRAGADLQLSGHTHGGQFLPWNFFVRWQQPFTAGLHQLGELWVYVSRGTGYWGPPKRVGAPAEITHLRLVPA